jgi:predicted aspartyl protease
LIALWGLFAVLLAGAQCAPVEVPFELDTDRGGIVVRVGVNGREGTALLDTGAGHTVVSPQLLGAADARLPAGSFSRGRPGFTAVGIWASARLSLGLADLGSKPVEAMDMSEVSRVYRRRIDGLVGQDVLARYGRVEIDFEARRIRLLRKRRGRPADDGCPGELAPRPVPRAWKDARP